MQAANSDDDVDMILMISSIVRMMRMSNTAMVNAQGACVCFQTLVSILVRRGQDTTIVYLRHIFLGILWFGIFFVVLFLAVQDSSITDIVGWLVCPLEPTNNQSLDTSRH